MSVYAMTRGGASSAGKVLLPVLLPVLFWGGVLCCSASPAAHASLPERPQKQLKFNYDKQHKALYVTNQEVGPYTVTLLFPVLDNATTDCGDPCVLLVPPGRHRLVTFRQKDPFQAFHFKYKYRSRRGNFKSQVNLRHIYELPFAPGFEAKLGQAYNGSFTHKGQYRYALDFHLPLGTPIHAAREGLVIWTVDRFTEAGTDSDEFKGRDNRVEILHDDGSVARYGHLQRHGVRVRPGQRVKAGQLIGLSGNTGFSNGPHLHFHVYQPVNGELVNTLPTLFRTTDGLQILKSGNRYTRPLRP